MSKSNPEVSPQFVALYRRKLNAIGLCIMIVLTAFIAGSNLADLSGDHVTFKTVASVVGPLGFASIFATRLVSLFNESDHG